MENHNGTLFTSESVTEGHPDKIADQISDAILDAALTEDPMSRVACETLLTTGLVIVADWIASNEDYFPYLLDSTDEDRLRSGWELLDLPVPWRPAAAPVSVDDLFGTRFALPAGAALRPVQRTAAESAETMPVPGMMIVEAAMVRANCL